MIVAWRIESYGDTNREYQYIYIYIHIYIDYYSLVHPIGINIFPIGCSLLPIVCNVIFFALYEEERSVGPDIAARHEI